MRGGAPLTLCECATAGGGAWLQDGTIIFAGSALTSGLGGAPPYSFFRIPEAGGTAAQLLSPETDRAGLSYLWPRTLPGGTAVLFTITNVLETTGSRVAVLSLETGAWRVLIENGYNAHYVPTGHLVFGRQGALWGVPFDPDQLATTDNETLTCFLRLSCPFFVCPQVTFSWSASIPS